MPTPPSSFKEDRENDPSIWEDEYGDRGRCQYSALALLPCGNCMQLACAGCSQHCSLCGSPVCRRCPLRSTSCWSCRSTIDDNDDHDIGPVDRSAGVCNACWHGEEPVTCGCGELSFDPDAPPEGEDGEDAEDAEEGEETY